MCPTPHFTGNACLADRLSLSECHSTDEILSLGTPVIPLTCLASLFAAPVHLFEKVAHYADKRREKPEKQQKQGNSTPQRTVGRQTGLKIRRHERHPRRDQREEHERSGENVKIAGHRCGHNPRNLLRSYAEKPQPKSVAQSTTETPALANSASILAAEPFRSMARQASRRTYAGRPRRRASRAE